MSLYPSLEDMKVDHMVKAEVRAQQHVGVYPHPTSNSYPSVTYPGTNEGSPVSNSGAAVGSQMYPGLHDFMGLELSEEMIAQIMPEYKQIAVVGQNAVVPTHNTASNLIAPLSNQTLGLRKAQVTHGIRELILCKGQDGKVGLRVKAIDNGIFACLVKDKSPAALAGLRFGDQILQINEVIVAGFSMEHVHDLLKKSPNNGISIVVRDRPFERTLTLHKDSTGHVGFQFKNGKITTVVKDSSAARNGVLIEHHLLEIDGQNVVGLKDKEISKIIDKCQGVVTITVMPTVLYDHMVKRMAGSLLKDLMDHSVPNV